MAEAIFETDLGPFLSKALEWSKSFRQVALFQSNNFSDPYGKLSLLMALDADAEFSAFAGEALKGLDAFRNAYPDQWLPGFLAYDLKNEIEALSSRHEDLLGFPDGYFFVPKIIIRTVADRIAIRAENPAAIFQAIDQTEVTASTHRFQGTLETRMSKQAYSQAFDQLRAHIKKGDIYEANLCQEFFATDSELQQPELFYQTLNRISPTPFSAYFKWNSRYIFCASPERFLAKRGKQLISQPIKGTAPRGQTPEDDERLKQQLLHSQKEKAENVMIVDLVRNDLTRSATPGSVRVAEKLAVYSFQQVHQMISTVICEQHPALTETQVIKHTFPPGSMTGAPKISAMRLCDQFEASRRGVYSGSIGYFSPDGDFDFNVVIRSVLYNADKRYLSFHTGSAITIDANAAHEYQECYTKASAIFQALGQNH